MGGGVSRETRIYASVPELLPRYVYAPSVETPIVPGEVGRCERGARRRDALAEIMGSDQHYRQLRVAVMLI